MKRCKHIQNQFIEAAYHELSPEEQGGFDEHLVSCSSCAQKYQEFRASLNKMDQLDIPEKSDSYWETYWDGLVEKLPKQGASPKPSRKKMRFILRQPAFGWALGVACAFVIGILIGRVPWQQEPDSLANLSEEQIRMASMQTEVSRYLDRSKVILLGITNLDSEPVDFAQQQAKSAELVSEAPVLRSKLTEMQKPVLAELVSQLEVILIQIANLETQHDVDGIQLIQSGSKQTALMLKINIGEMLLSDQDWAMQPTPSAQQPTI